MKTAVESGQRAHKRIRIIPISGYSAERSWHRIHWFDSKHFRSLDGIDQVASNSANLPLMVLCGESCIIQKDFQGVDC